MSAYISPDGIYRYWLRRQIDELYKIRQKWRPIVFVMLNPSTADADTDDQTIRRCISFARAWGYSELIVVNLYAFRATDPKLLINNPAAIGRFNDSAIAASIENKMTVVAWGNNAPSDRVAEFCEIAARRLPPFNSLWCLGTTKSGSPRHPCRLAADTKLRAWHPPA